MKSLGKIATIIILLLFLQTCNKIKLPELTTKIVSEIASTSAASGGTVTNNGGDDVTSRGVCWSTVQNPTISSDTTKNGSGNGLFKSKISRLAANTTYFVRAYATNSKGVAYGNEVSFKTITQCTAPAVTTKTATNPGPTTATLNASVNASGSSTDVTFEYGLTTAYGLSIAATQSPVTGNTITDVSAGITGLTQSSSYHYRVKAVNCGGTINGSDQIFQTTCTAPVPGVGTITQTTCAVATGSVIMNGLPATGTWTLTRTPGGTVTTGTGTSTTVAGLAPGTYTFSVADASGCVSPASGNVVINAQSSSPTVPGVGTITQPTCSLATGSVVLTGLPSPEAWTIKGTPGGITTTGTGTSSTITGLAAGTYTFTVTNAGGCVSAASANVVINAQPITPSAPVVGTITQPICPITTGSVALSGLPATGTWVLTRNPGGTSTTGTGTTTNIALLPAGATYTFTVTSSSACTSVASNNVVINALALPSATTGAVTNVTPTSATFTGSANGNGSPSVVTFEYGTTTAYGSEIPADQSPITTGNTAVSREVTNLTMHTLYHYRVKIVSCAGAVFGNDQEFTTPFPFTNSGLVAFYPFNGNANDESGNGHNGIFLDGAKLATDKNGVANKACSVNPGYVQIADNTSLNLSSYTLSIWFKTEAVTSAFNCLIGKNYTIAYGIGFDSGGSGVCPAPITVTRPMKVYASNRSNTFNNSDFSCNTWYHVVVTYNDATGDVNLYINGNLWENGTLPPGTIGNSSDPLAIGKDGHFGDKFTGLVDEVSIFNRVLTMFEVSQLFNYYK